MCKEVEMKSCVQVASYYGLIGERVDVTPVGYRMSESWQAPKKVRRRKVKYEKKETDHSNPV